MSEAYYLPKAETVSVTPELLVSILAQFPEHTEGDFAITVPTEKLKALLEAAGHEVVIGYQTILTENERDDENE